ncbi:MAG: hypothetical protein HP490_07405 [Nitrospira sp.]|nr:hypothetical protein [Nitrospira sp.]
MKTVVLSKGWNPWTMVFRRGLCTAGCLSFMWMAGCGAPSSDKVSGQESRAAIAGSNQSATAQHINQGISRPGLLSDVSQVENTGSSNQRNRPVGKDDESSQPQFPKLPESIAKDLASPDARERFRALNHPGFRS